MPSNWFYILLMPLCILLQLCYFVLFHHFPGIQAVKCYTEALAPAPADSTPRFQSAPAVVQRPGPV